MTREWYLSQLNFYAHQYADVAGLLVLCVILILFIGYLLREGQRASAESKRLEWLHSAYKPLTPEQQIFADKLNRDAEARILPKSYFERKPGK